MGLKEKTFKYWIHCYLYNNRYILYLQQKKKKCKYKCFYDLLLLVSLPYMVFRWGILFIYENLYGKRNVNRKMNEERYKDFKHEIAIVSISKNEGPYIREWVEYHKLVGINKFYFYDNESDDETKRVLQPYIDEGIVEYSFFPGKARQLDAYNDAIMKHKSECRWMAFIDMDEFLLPTVPFKPISEIVSEIVFKAGGGAVGVSVNWAIYGSSHFDEKPEGLVIENFVNRALPTHWSCFIVKTICNPRMVKDFISPHYPLYKIGAYSVNDSDGERQYGWYCYQVAYQQIRVNHYFSKSKQEYLKKQQRGLADRVGKYEMSKFNVYDLNDIHDETMKVYSEIIKQNLIK